MKIDIKQIVEQSKAIQNTQEKTIEEYKVMKEEEFNKSNMNSIRKMVKFELS